MKITTKSIIEKKGVEKIVAITAYDSLFAKLADEAGVDIILVGDSVGNNVLGFENTISVTLDMMIHHTAAVARANPRAMIVGDMPFGVSHYKGESLLKAAVRFLQEGGAQAVKMEGGKESAERIATLVEAGIPVMGHIGLQPQKFLKLGGYKKFGKTEGEFESMLEDAKAVRDAGAFSLVIEMTDSETARKVSSSIDIPTIGIGSGNGCDGEIRVITDVLGLSEFSPKFAKKYANLRETAREAIKNFSREVKGDEGI